jgi:hypothetical protein
MPDLGPEGLFQLDERSLKAISELQYRLRAQSSAEVIRNALALLKIAVDNADPDSLVITIVGRDGKFLKVDLKPTT